MNEYNSIYDSTPTSGELWGYYLRQKNFRKKKFRKRDKNKRKVFLKFEKASPHCAKKTHVPKNRRTSNLLRRKESERKFVSGSGASSDSSLSAYDELCNSLGSIHESTCSENSVDSECRNLEEEDSLCYSDNSFSSLCGRMDYFSLSAGRIYGIASTIKCAPVVSLGSSTAGVKFNNQLGVLRTANHLILNTSIRKEFDTLCKMAGIKSDDHKIWREIEGMIFLLGALQECESCTSFLCTLGLYFGRFTDASLCVKLGQYIETTILNMTNQTGSEDKLSPEWLSMLRNCRSDWLLVKNNCLFNEFSKLLGLLVTFKLCEASSLTFTIKDYTVFEPDLQVVHMGAVDLIDAALGTVTFFVENIYESYNQGSFKPFLISDKVAFEIEEEYSLILSWWELVKNGNLWKVKQVGEHEFTKRLEDLTTRVKNLLVGKKSFEKKILEDKYRKLLGILDDHANLKMSSKLRFAPFTIELFGSSSQGKTVLGDQLIDAILTSAGLPIGLEYRATYNASDKYMSNWKTNKTVLVIDDMANDDPNFIERAPTRAIVDFCNNQPLSANMPDLDSKGKTWVEPMIVVVNTNVKNLGAGTYSVNPYSIQRRMHVVISVRAKKQFQRLIDGKPQGIDPAKVEAHYRGSNAPFDELWELTLEVAVSPKRMSEVAKYEVIEDDEFGRLENIPFRFALQYMIKRFHQHKREQERLLERVEMRKNDELKLCGCTYFDEYLQCETACKQIAGYCDRHSFTNQSGFGDQVVKGFGKAKNIVAKRLFKDFNGADSAVEGAVTCGLLYAAKRFSKHWDWLSIVPSQWVAHPHFSNVLMGFDYLRIKRQFVKRSLLLWATLGLGMCIVAKTSPTIWVPVISTPVAVTYGVVRQQGMVERVKTVYRMELLKRNTITPALRMWRDEHGPLLWKAAGFVGCLYAIAKIYGAFRRMNNQGSLEPVSISEIEERSSEKSPWSRDESTPREVPEKSQCAVVDELVENVQKNLLSVVAVGPKKKYCNALFLKTGLAVIPNHFLTDDEMKVEMSKVNKGKPGGSFTTILSRDCSWNPPNTDLRVCFVHNGGSFKDLTKYFAKSNLPPHEFKLVFRDEHGKTFIRGGMSKHGLFKKPENNYVSNETGSFLGGIYGSLSFQTFEGLCGAALVSCGSGPTISGFHLGGREGTPYGCFGFLSSTQISDAMNKIKEQEGVLIGGCDEVFPNQSYGVSYSFDKDKHPKSALNFIESESQLEFVGSNCKTVKSNSNVKVTKISALVSIHMNSHNIWRSPKMKPEYYAWQTCLSNMAQPGLSYSPKLLAKAIYDYKSAMVEVFSREYIQSMVKPLTDHENLNGIPGCQFIDAIDMNTSMGFPLRGAKRQHVNELEPTVDCPLNRVFQPHVVEEIERFISCYERGVRACPIAKGCKKDEVLSKDKCRVFFSNPVALTFLIRRYYLPIVRILQLYPLRSECAVGINAHGREWNELHEHILKFGKDRIIAGDYGKYDQKLTSQLLLASLRILCDFAKMCGYTERDLRIMEAMSSDIVYAYVLFNGDLVKLTQGTHISGNSLTVVLNSICGSLNMRCAFFSKFGGDFRSKVALMTYGDDNIGTVSSDVQGFDIKYISEFLHEHGQVYTMPDKESEITAFLDPLEFEFLKRKSVYCAERGVFTGALCDKSIFKRLHCYLRPKGCVDSEELACAKNIDSALLEWSHHGRDVYEKRRKELQTVAREADIEYLCLELNKNYDTRISEWKLRYS